MIIIALKHRLREVSRQTSAKVCLALLLAAGIWTIWLGHARVEVWQQVIAAPSSTQAQAQQVMQWLMEGKKGPEDRPWVDVTQVFWLERSLPADHRWVPNALAPLAASSMTSMPVINHLTTASQPHTAQSFRIANPMLDTFFPDVTLVFTWIVPLVIFVLGVGVFTLEKEQRVDTLIAFSAAPRAWYIWSMSVPAGLVWAVVMVLCGGACIAFSASIDESLVLMLSMSLYVLLWAALVLLINIVTASIRTAALGFCLLWITMVIVLPSALAEYRLSLSVSDYGMEETLDTREYRYATREAEMDSWLPTLLAQYPTSKIAYDNARVLPSQLPRVGINALTFSQTKQQHHNHLLNYAETQALVDGLSLLAPNVALTLIMERLAGTGTEALLAYQQRSIEQIQARVDWSLAKVWRDLPLTKEDANELLALAPAPYQWQPQGFTTSLLVLLFWTIGVWTLIAWVLSRRAGV